MSIKIKHLTAENAIQTAAIGRYQSTIAQLQEYSALREGLSNDDTIDSLENERSRATIIGIIGGTKNEDNDIIAPVLLNTIDSLFNPGAISAGTD